MIKQTIVRTKPTNPTFKWRPYNSVLDPNTRFIVRQLVVSEEVQQSDEDPHITEIRTFRNESDKVQIDDMLIDHLTPLGSWITFYFLRNGSQIVSNTSEVIPD